MALPQSDVTPGGEMGAADLSATLGGETTTVEGDGAGAVSGLLDEAEVDDQQPGPLDLGADQLGPDDLDDEAGASELGDEGDTGTSATGDVEAAGIEVDHFGDDEFDEDEADEDEDTGELVYELAEWLPEQRVELSMLLESAGVAYNWDGSDLTVAEEHEDEVDGLFEQVHGVVDEDDEARYHSIEELFGAVDRLANDPADEDRRRPCWSPSAWSSCRRRWASTMATGGGCAARVTLWWPLSSTVPATTRSRARLRCWLRCSTRWSDRQPVCGA